MYAKPQNGGPSKQVKHETNSRRRVSRHRPEHRFNRGARCWPAPRSTTSHDDDDAGSRYHHDHDNSQNHDHDNSQNYDHDQHEYHNDQHECHNDQHE
jgi:hypothetical protein